MLVPSTEQPATSRSPSRRESSWRRCGGCSPGRPPPARPQLPPSGLDDFDVEVAVDSEEPVDAMELTGRVVLAEDGKVSAVLRGETITAAPLGTPARPTPPAPPQSAVSVREEQIRRSALERTEGKLEDNLPELITAFYIAQQTGELTLQKGKVKKTLFFDKGLPFLRHLQPHRQSLRPLPRPRG